MELGYRLFDADNHYYEPEDAFLRYVDPHSVHAAPRWVELANGDGKRLVFGDRMNRYLGADQTFARVGTPGLMNQGDAARGTIRAALGPPPAAARDRDRRLALMDRQGLEATLLFPTLAVSVEQLLAEDVVATYANLRAFNRWLEEDWGFAYDDRLYGVPLLSLLDPASAAEELDHVLARGARVVHLRPGPVGGRSPADPVFDGFWARLTEAGAAIAFHASDHAYRYELARMWGWGNVNVQARHIPPLHRIIASHDRCIHDTIAALIYGRLFERFPELRVASVELGCAWVPDLLHNMAEAGKGRLDVDPIETFRTHVWVAPFEHEDLHGLADAIGVERIMFGSDYPHIDGLAEPATYADSLKGFDGDDVRRIMRDNARMFIQVAA